MQTDHRTTTRPIPFLALIWSNFLTMERIASMPIKLHVMGLEFLLGMALCVGSQAHSGASTPDKCLEACLRARALAGDANAAIKYHGFVIVRYKGDSKTIREWDRIGAENGSSVSEYNYAIWLLSDGGKENWERAIFWLEKSAGQGDPDAKRVLAEVRSSKHFGERYPPLPSPPKKGS